MSDTFDCLVVGAGVIGLSITYELAKHGMRIGVVDPRTDDRSSASWAAAGILPPPARVGEDPLEVLRQISHDRYPHWSAELKELTGIDIGYRECGAIYLARHPAEQATLRAEVSRWQGEGIVVDSLPLAKLPHQEPSLAHLVGSNTIAYSVPHECQVRSPHQLRALRQACQESGVTFIYETAIALGTGRNPHTLMTSHGQHLAQTFCIAAGAPTATLLRGWGIELAVEPIRGQIILWKTEGPMLRSIINQGLRYLVDRGDGHLLVGATVERVGFDLRPTQSGYDHLVSFAHELLPSLGNRVPDRIWTGLRPGNPRSAPYLDRLPGRENVFVAAGHFRSGIHVAPATATIMAALIRGDAPSIDMRPYRFD